MHCFKDLPIDKTRSAVGRFGITGKAQTQPIKNLSDGLRSRVVFAKLAYDTPNMVDTLPLSKSSFFCIIANGCHLLIGGSPCMICSPKKDCVITYCLDSLIA